MNEMTPEKLRELLLVGTTKPSDEVRQMISAAASAWEADRKMLRAARAQATVVLRAYNLARAEILNLRDAIDGKTHLRDASRVAEEEK